MDSKGALTIFDTPGKNCPLNILTPNIYIVNTTLELTTYILFATIWARKRYSYEY